MEQLTNDIYQYISEQDDPVSVQAIVEHLPAKQNKHTINRILIALCRCGNLKRSLKDGKAYYSDPDAKLHRMMGELDANYAKLETLLKDAGIDLHPSNIGDTGFDMYNWTFTKKVRRKVVDWSVGIPDGFSVIPSAENRAFEAVPQGQEDVNEEERKVWIGAGQSQAYEVDMPAFYSPYARQGFMDVQAAALAKAYQSTVLVGITDIAPDAFSIVTDDVSVVVTVFQTEDCATVYQIGIPTGERIQILQVRVSFMTPEQRENMGHSIVEWAKTFRGNKPNLPVLTMPALSDVNLVKQIKHGKFSEFELAVKHAYDEEKFSLVGTISLMRYRMNNGIPVENAETAVREGMEHGAEVAFFYTRLADELCGKLEKEKVSSETMLRVYTKLQELIIDIDDININGKSIHYSVPGDVKRMREKWTAAVENIKKQENEAKKRAEDSQKAEAKAKQRKIRNYIDAEKKWESAYVRIATEQEKLVNNKINAEKKKIMASAMQEKEAALEKANAKVKEQMDRKKGAEATLASLGIFKFSEKKAQKEIIEDANKQIVSAQASIDKANKDYTFKAATADESAKAKRSEFQKQAEAEIPFPAEPERPDFIKKQEEQLTRHDEEKAEGERQNLRKILGFVKRNSERHHYCTREDIQHEFPSIQYSDLTKLTEKGLFERILLGSKFVYLPTDNANQLVYDIFPIPKPRRFSIEELEKLASEEMQEEEKRPTSRADGVSISSEEKEAVLNYLRSNGACTLSDIINGVPALSGATTAKIRKIIDRLQLCGNNIEVEVVRGRVVYWLK